MSRLIVLFLLISCYFITCCKAQSPCKDLYGAISDVYGRVGENICLMCSVPRNCTRGYWKYDNTINVTWLLPEEYSGDTYLFTFIPSQGLNNLYIVNINDSFEGFYTCLCDDRNGRRTAEACFNLSVHAVKRLINVQTNGENEHGIDRCGARGEAEMVDVEVNDNISIKCDDAAKRRTNCSQIRKHYSYVVKLSRYVCRFNCRPERNSPRLEVGWIILNVKNQNNSPTTSVTSKAITSRPTPARKWPSPTTANVILPSSSSDPFKANESKTSTVTQNITPLSSTSDSGSTRGDAYMYGTDTSITTTLSPPLFSGLSSIFVASCVIFVLIIIILILCVHINFYKIGIRSCNDKEEWVNPLYESADNRAQSPTVIPDGGNPYDTVNSQVADPSNAMSTINNVGLHQINTDLGSTNEIPMVQVGASQHAAIKLLGYTVTASNVGSMELDKPSCKKIEKSPAKTEILSLPKGDDISPPPASPHLYEMLNDEVRS